MPKTNDLRLAALSSATFQQFATGALNWTTAQQAATSANSSGILCPGLVSAGTSNTTNMTWTYTFTKDSFAMQNAAMRLYARAVNISGKRRRLTVSDNLLAQQSGVMQALFELLDGQGHAYETVRNPSLRGTEITIYE